MFERPRLHPTADPVEHSGVDDPAVEAEVVVEGGPDVPDRLELLPDPRFPQVLLILVHMNTCGETSTS